MKAIHSSWRVLTALLLTAFLVLTAGIIALKKFGF